MRAVSYTHNPRILAALNDFYAINSALEVDLTGQINAEAVGGRHLGTIGGQGAFARAALTSTGGRSIIALASTAHGGETTKIVAQLSDGVVTTSRADADLIVTEHGVADLRGATISERRRRLIAIADPRHRDGLERHMADRC
jgi:acetyl-CoA hydrolase